MIKRWLIGSFFLITLLLSGAGYLLLSTTAGLRFTLQTVVDTVPLSLKYTNLQGTILSTIRADSAQYADDTVTVKISQFETRFSIRSLLIGRLAFGDIKSNGVEVILIDEPTSVQAEVSQNEKADIQSGDAGLPITISLENAHIKMAYIKDQQDTLLKLADIRLAKGKIQNNFRFRDLSFNIEPGTFTATGNIGFAELEEVEFEAGWKTSAINGLPAASGELTAKGTYRHLNVDAGIAAPEVMEVAGEINNLFSDLAWKAVVSGERLPLSVFDAALETELLEFQLTANGDLKDVVVSGKSHLRDAQYGHWSAVIDSRIGASQIELRNLRLQSLDSSAVITATGTSQQGFSYSAMGPLRVSTSWEKMQWPLTGEPVVMSDSGQAEVQGSGADYQLRLINTVLDIKQHKLKEFNASGNGNLEKLEIAEFSTKYLDGLWRGNGRLNWKNEFQWNASLTAKGVNPSIQWPEWSAKLNGTANISGVHKQDAWQITGDVKKVRGVLAELPVDQASLDFVLAENVYAIKNLKFVSQQNKIRAAAQLKAMPDDKFHINASWNIDSQNLTQLLPDVKGILKSEGNLQGDMLSPQLSTSIRAQGLVYKDYTISSIEGVVNIDPKIEAELLVRLKLDGIKKADIQIEDLSLRGKGTTGDHELKLSSKVDSKRSLSLTARGGYAGEVWKGKLYSSLVRTAKFGNWEQQGPSNISVSASRLTADYYCLTPIEVNANVCVKVDSDYFKSWSGAVNIKNLPVKTFETYFPPQIISLQGVVNGSANYHFQENVIKTFDANLVSDRGVVEFGLSAGERQKLDYKQLQTNITHNSQGISVVSKVDLREAGEVDIRATLKNKHTLSELDSSQLIDGRVVVDLKNLTILPLIYPDIQYIDGQKYSEYTISGSIGNPVVVGRSDIKAKSITLPRLGIELKNVRADARTDKGNNLKVSGEASSGDGKIVFQGEILDYLSANLNATLHIEGNNFLATKTPEFVLYISPNVTTTVRNDLMRMEGTITIPSASIQMVQSSATVAPSADVVIVDENSQPVEQARKTLALDAELKIILGDNVRIEGYGANGRLRGEVLVREQPGTVTTGRGEIQFEDGRFSAYNRELTIETGILTFANSPIDNPIVAIQAVRRIDRQDVKVKVGVEVTGQAQNPKVELFSEPAMDQSDILSYMILGYPMNQATEKDGTTLSTAAGSIGLFGGELLANEIASKLGIDIENIRITTDAATQQPLVGAYLNPRLYAEYVMGVGQAVNTFRIEYNLTNRWVLKTETSSEQQGADLLYTIEVD